MYETSVRSLLLKVEAQCLIVIVKELYSEVKSNGSSFVAILKGCSLIN